jgi:hypothetical protein
MKTLRLLLLLLTCAAGVRAATDITLYTGDYSTNTLGTNSIAIIVWDDGELGRIVRMSDSAFLTNMTARGFASTNLLESVSNVVASLAIANDTTTSNALRTTFVSNDTTTSNALYSLIGSATSGTNFHHIRVTNDIYAAGSVLIPTMDADSVVITDSNKKLTTGPTTAAALALIANLSADAETRLDNLDGSTNALNAKTNFVNLNASEGITSRTARATAIRLTGSTASRAVVLNGSGDLTNATTTAAEIEHVSGVTSAIQTQLDSKVAYTGTPGTISNVNAIIFAEHSPAITTSNLFLSFDTNLHTCIGLTNLVLTNWQERATGSDDMNLFVHNTTAVTMGVVWPAYGAQHGYYFGTNANNDVLSSTSIAAGGRRLISVKRIGTNLFPTITTW